MKFIATPGRLALSRFRFSTDSRASYLPPSGRGRPEGPPPPVHAGQADTGPAASPSTAPIPRVPPARDREDASRAIPGSA